MVQASGLAAVHSNWTGKSRVVSCRVVSFSSRHERTRCEGKALSARGRRPGGTGVRMSRFHLATRYGHGPSRTPSTDMDVSRTVRPAFRFLVFDVPPRDLNLTMIRTCTDPSYRSCWIHPSQPRPIPRQMCVTGCHIIRDRELVQRDDAVLVCCNTYGTHARLSPNIVPVRGLCMHTC